MTSLRVAIIGGGIGGLTLAVALSKLDLDSLIKIDIYEAASELTQVGAGISFWPRTWDIIEKLGLDAELAEHLALGQRIPDGKPRLAFQFRKADQREGVPIIDLVISSAPLSFHRANMQEVLLKHLPQYTECHLASCLVSYDILPEEISITFEDGRTATCDILIGADGLRSTVRKQFSPSSELVWSGTYAYRGLIDSDIIKGRMPEHRVLSHPTIYCGKNKHVIAYPILQGKVVNIVAYLSDLRLEGTVYEGRHYDDVQKDEVVSLYGNWEEEVRVLIEHMDKPSRWAIQAIKPLELYAENNVFLLGDAAHAMVPHQGNGAGQAIEDAYVLAHLIEKTVRNKLPLDKLNKVYDEIRRPFANFVQDASRTHGLLYELNAPGFESIDQGGKMSEEELARLGNSIIDDWEYAWTTTIDEDLKKGINAIIGK